MVDWEIGFIIVMIVALISLFPPLTTEKHTYHIEGVEVTKEFWCWFEKHIVFPRYFDKLMENNKTYGLNMTAIEIVEESVNNSDFFKDCGFKINW